MYEHVVETQYMNWPGVLCISVLVIAPEGQGGRLMFTWDGGGGGVHNNLAGRSQNNNEKGCCQITVRIGRTIKKNKKNIIVFL